MCYCFCRKRRRITKRKSDDDSESEFSLSDEAAAEGGSTQALSDSASFETDSELSDDPLGEYDDADEDMYEQRRHKYARGDKNLNFFTLQKSAVFFGCMPAWSFSAAGCQAC